MCPRGGHDGGPREEEFPQGRGARDAEVQGEVFGGEDEALEEGRGGADLGEVGDGFGGFDEGEDGDGGSALLFLSCSGGEVGEGVCDRVRDEGEVRGGVDFGDYEGGEVGGLELTVCESVSCT